MYVRQELWELSVTQSVVRGDDTGGVGGGGGGVGEKGVEKFTAHSEPKLK